MSVIPVGFGGGGAAPYQIGKSLRFRSSASTRLQRTFGTPTSTTIWTYSTWVKRGALSGTFRLLGASTNTFLTFNASDQINLTLNGTSAATSLAVLRDPAAHYHVVYQQNGASQTIWVNNISVATGTTAASVFNTAIAHEIGAANTASFFDGYLSEIYWIDGQALLPSSFGEIDSVTGVWVPKRYAGTYGANGFYLPFNDGTSLTTLTEDRSGNGNNWTATNISLTAGATYDWMDDTPTNNFATLNPLLVGTSALTNGNLTSAGATLSPTIIPSSGTYYLERDGSALTWTPPAAFPAAAGAYNFGQRPFVGSPTHPLLKVSNLAVSIDNPSEQFDVVLDAGANIKATAEGLYTDQLVWIKDRVNATPHQLIDSVRGTSLVLQSSSINPEAGYSTPAGTSVGWVWKAQNTGVANTDGTISSTVSANTTAGFSIVTYTGTGANATVGHGLGAAPKMLIVKRRDSASDWPVLHTSIPAANTLRLNLSLASASVPTMWNSTYPTSTVFSIGTSVDTNTNAAPYVAYCFAEIEGYSKIGGYTGNGNVNGPFVYCGFLPKFVMIKSSSVAGEHWEILDFEREEGLNGNESLLLFANLVNVENIGSGTAYRIDFVSNGFKVRGLNPGNNSSSQSYVFIAFAESPFNYSRAR